MNRFTNNAPGDPETAPPAADEFQLSATQSATLRRIADEEETRAERTAARYKMFFSGAFLLFSIISRLSGRPIEEFVVQLVGNGTFFLFNFGVYILLSRPGPYRWYLKYLSTFVEMTVLSLCNGFLAYVQKDPTVIYTAPMTLIYFILIALAAIRSNTRVILFAIAVFVVQFAGLSILFWPEMKALNEAIRANAEIVNPHQFAIGQTFSIITGRPVGVFLKILYTTTAGFAAIFAIRIAHRIATRQTRHIYQETVDRLIELDRIKTNFFTNISHEFRTPLTLILGPIDTMLESAPPERASELKIVRNNARRLLRMINNLLDVSRLEGGKFPIEKQRVELVAFSREIVELFRSTVEARGLRVEFRSAAAEIQISADPGHLERVYMNLLGNALKFTPEGVIRVELQDDSDAADIRITDTGPGIPVEGRDRIFERFSTLAEVRSLPGEGTGLGLSLVKELVEAHGGAVDYFEPEGGGAGFRIRLPHDSEADHAGAFDAGRNSWELTGRDLDLHLSDIDKSENHKNENDSRTPAAALFAGDGSELKTILIAEDRADMRGYLMSLLGEEYRVLLAGDGREAVQRALEEAPDLILSDVMMPNMDGYTLLEQVRLSPSLAAVPFLLLTAKSEANDRVRGLMGGADDFISKPFSPAELRARIARCLQRVERQKLALGEVREEMIADMHDHLGGSLTDLSLSLRRARRELNPAAIDEIQANFDRTLQAFKGVISSPAHFRDLSENFLDSLHAVLLRRYYPVERILEFRTDAHVRKLFLSLRDARLLRALYGVCQEMTTNDLKYGTGSSVWRLRAVSGGIGLRFSSRIAPAPEGAPGLGRETMRNRLAEIDGTLHVRTFGNLIVFRVFVPVAASAS